MAAATMASSRSRPFTTCSPKVVHSTISATSQAWRWPRRTPRASSSSARPDSTTNTAAACDTASGMMSVTAWRRGRDRRGDGGDEVDHAADGQCEGADASGALALEPVRLVRREGVALGPGGDDLGAGGVGVGAGGREQPLEEGGGGRLLPGVVQPGVEPGPGLELEERLLAADHPHGREAEAARPLDRDGPAAAGVGVEAAAQVGELGLVGVPGDEPRVALGHQATRERASGVVLLLLDVAHAQFTDGQRLERAPHRQPPEHAHQGDDREDGDPREAEVGGDRHRPVRDARVVAHAGDDGHHEGHERHQQGQQQPTEAAHEPAVQQARRDERADVAGVGEQLEPVEPLGTGLVEGRQGPHQVVAERGLAGVAGVVEGVVGVEAVAVLDAHLPRALARVERDVGRERELGPQSLAKRGDGGLVPGEAAVVVPREHHHAGARRTRRTPGATT